MPIEAIAVSAQQINMPRGGRFFSVSKAFGARLKGRCRLQKQIDVTRVIGIADMLTQLLGKPQ
jgi:hypothetical protein